MNTLPTAIFAAFPELVLGLAPLVNGIRLRPRPFHKLERERRTSRIGGQSLAANTPSN